VGVALAALLVAIGLGEAVSGCTLTAPLLPLLPLLLLLLPPPPLLLPSLAPLLLLPDIRDAV
jgi:hypothetical protein